jgi:hypothetical protein
MLFTESLRALNHIKPTVTTSNNYSFKYNQQDATLYNILYYLHVSGGFSAHRQELKNCTHSIWYVPGLSAAIAKCLPRCHITQ